MTLTGWIWRGLLLFVILTAIYASLTFMNRLREKDRLNKAYIETQPNIDKTEFVATGMVRYSRSLKAKLVLGVYLVPIAIFGLLIYLAQL